MAAKNKLVASNLRIVQGVVNVYIKNGIQEQYNAGDMMQEGIIVSLSPIVSNMSSLKTWSNMVHYFMVGSYFCLQRR